MMRLRRSDTEPPIFFSYGTPHPGAEPLALLGGSLILDAGEADQSFLLRCQDRFVTYAWLLGLRPILLVADADHGRRHADAVAELGAACVTLAAATGLPDLVRPLDPLILGCDPLDAFVHSAVPLPELAGRATYHLNQMSPTAAALLGGIDAVLSAHGVDTGLDRIRCRADGERALRFQDKATARALVEACLAPASCQLPTATIGLADFGELADWDAFTARYREGSGDRGEITALVIKSTRDSAGNVAAAVTAGNFVAERGRLLAEIARSTGDDGDDAALRAIRADIDASRLDPAAFPDERLRLFERLRRSRRAGLALFVQRRVSATDAGPGRPAALGLSFQLDRVAGVRIIAASAQTYHDDARRHFRGAVLDDRIEAGFCGTAFEQEMHAICERFLAAGYEGPIGFDALLDREDRYVLIHDCNPRLSAVFPPLALRRALTRTGARPASVLNLGYRGDYVIPDPAGALAMLDEMGLLYSAGRRSGLVLLPSLVRPQAYDLFLVDAAPEALDRAAPILAEAGCHTALSSAIPGLPPMGAAR